MGETRLKRDCSAGLVVGCNGGWDNWFRIAVAFDTRDFEPDPNSGVLVELSAEIGSRVLGSQYDYVRALASVRGFYSPIPWLADLVIGGRAVLQGQTSGTPFFSMNNMPFTEDNKWGLGGFRTLRGYKQDRFVGPVMALLNLELRWTFVHFQVLRQKLALIAVPFFDVGASFDDLSRFTLKTLKHGQGGGLRIAWNQATIIYCDVAFSDEDTGIYINFSHIF
jgi:outer membrane protein assembly factor BamA